MINKKQRPVVRIAATILTFSTLGLCGITAAQALPPTDGDAGSAVMAHVRPAPLTPTPVKSLVLPASIPAQPMPINLETFNENSVTRSGARRMSTRANYFPAEGRIVAQTRTWNSVKFTGFTGGVVVMFENAQGQAIGYTTMHKFGVDGTWVGASSRTDFWQESVTAPWASQATRIVAVHSHAHTGRLVAIVEEGVRAGKPILTIINEIQNARPSK